jgi:deoxyribodipyrimidine photo-lyase
VLPLYVLDDETPGSWRSGAASRWWLHHSLASLGRDVPLVFRRGSADQVLAAVAVESGARAIHFTRDYQPWSAALEARIKRRCDEAGIACHRHGGFLLHEPESIATGRGTPFKVFTPFFRACLAAGEPRLPRRPPGVTWYRSGIAGDTLNDWRLLPARAEWAKGFEPLWQPGEAGALHRLRSFIAQGFPRYAEGRDRPAEAATSRLSPHLHFGEVSPAQVWQAVRAAQSAANRTLDAAAGKFLGEMLWREFSWHLLHHFADLPEKNFRPEFDGFPWRTDPEALAGWQRGETGYPIVDAGLRELWATGAMHNRVRMIAASFLIKHLLIDWRDGERWFWDTLVDADLASNAASWQWVAGTGADAAPYFRIFNPVLQGETFDPDGRYVKQWCPALARLPDAFLHRPWAAPAGVLRAAGLVLGRDYPHPVVDHGQARNRALAALKAMKGGP